MDRLREEARELDTRLDRFTVERADPTLADQIIRHARTVGQAAPASRESLFGVAGIRLGWPQVASIAAAIIVGFVLGWQDPLFAPTAPELPDRIIALAAPDGLE